jgi:hypothetical protein
MEGFTSVWKPLLHLASCETLFWLGRQDALAHLILLWVHREPESRQNTKYHWIVIFQRCLRTWYTDILLDEAKT